MRVIKETNWKIGNLRSPALLVVVLLLVLALGAKCESRFKGGTEDFTDERLATSLVIGQNETEYGVALAALAAYIAEIGFGFQVETVALTAEEVPDAISSGRVDVVLDARAPDNKRWFDDAAAAGTILSTGPTYFKNGFAVAGAANPRLGEVGADLLAAFRVMEIPLRRVDETATWFDENDIEGNHRAAVYFLWNFNYEDSWKAWMLWDPAERMRDSIERFTGLRYPRQYKGIEYDLDRFSRRGDE